MDQPEATASLAELATDVPELHLRQLGAHDAQAEHDLIQANAEFLTHNGDFADLVDKSAGQLAEEIVSGKEICFGIYLDGVMIGNANLIPQDASGIFVLSYWLAANATGHGYATAACRAALQYAKEKLGATEFYAGVKKQNASSVSLLERLGFEFIEDKVVYNRYHLKP